MTEQFDPRRHRAWEVVVTRRWSTYVLAETARQAREIAAAIEEAPDVALADDPGLAYAAHELRGRRPDLERTLALGAAGWGRRQLTAARALELIESPERPPAVMDTGELRHLGGWEWVALAAGVSPLRPELGVVRVAGGRALAHDGHRLHLAPVACPDGLWDAETLAAVTPATTGWAHEVTGRPDAARALELAAGPAGLELVDLAGAWEALRAARPGLVSLPGPEGQVLLDARLLAEALLGGAAATRIELAVRGQFEPVRLDFPGLGRTALVAPVREGRPSGDLGPFVRALGGPR